MDMLYSVDMFFWIGGFFLGFVACEVKKIAQIKKGGIGAIFIMITHRILRIWPCYLITILILWKIFPYLGDGPRWFL
jgi:peptidoglycan/LPS O-acetylase OafA/YrhL